MKDLHSRLAEQQLDQVADNPQILLIHPNYVTHRFLLDDLIAPEQTVYIRWDGKLGDSETLEAQVQQALQEQTETGDLTEVHNLVLDECDRVDEEAFNRFLSEVTDVIIKGNKGRIVLISRYVPGFVRGEIALKNLSVVIPTDDNLLLCDYVQETEQKALLEVHAFGSGRVYLDGREIDTWDGVLPRSLFFYLIDRGMVTRDEIFKIFWSKLSTKEATNVFHVTKRKISEVLGVDLTMYWSGFYRISPDIDLYYDVMAFSKMVQDSEVAPRDEARELLSSAIYLYRGDFLTSLDLEWTRQRRQSLLQTYGEALVSLAKMSHEAEETQKALGLYLRSSLTNPHREDLVYNIMSLYAELNMIQDALLCYERLESELSASLDLKPAPRLRELAESLRARAN